jgi:hypothetical protein
VPTKQRLRPDEERGPSLSRERSAQRSQVQPVAAAEAGPADLAPEDCELVAKDEDLDIVVPGIVGASRKGDQAAQAQVDEGEEHGSSLLSERPDPTKALLTDPISVSVPFMLAACYLHHSVGRHCRPASSRLRGVEVHPYSEAQATTLREEQEPDRGQMCAPSGGHQLGRWLNATVPIHEYHEVGA